jgi:hypothetical protein
VTREEILAEAEAALIAETWPAHPADDPLVPYEPFTLYLGAAGIIWALRRLDCSSLDLDALALQALEGYRASPNAEEPASLLAGETGLLVLTRSDDGRLAELVAANERNEAWEVLWGSPGTILAAKATGIDWRRSAEILAGEMDGDGLWAQTLVGGEPKRMLGSVHGFAGNVHALRGYLEDDELRAIVERVLRAHAVWDGDDAVNWPPVEGREADRVQWCHGAPGMVTTLGDLMPEDLLLAAAETTWRTGPLKKGPGLCHGTAGNGFALLRVYELTGDEVWLDRARSFADTALGQARHHVSLLTGDIGAVLLADACDRRDARFPIMDVL